MDHSSQEGGAQKRTRAKDVVIEAEPFTPFLKTKDVLPEETELKMHEYEQQDTTTPDHDAFHSWCNSLGYSYKMICISARIVQPILSFLHRLPMMCSS